MHLAIGSTGKEESQTASPLGLQLRKIKAKLRPLFAACSRVSGLCNVFPISLALLISGVFEQGDEERPFSSRWDLQLGSKLPVRAPADSSPCFPVNRSWWGRIVSVEWGHSKKNWRRCPEKEWKERSTSVSPRAGSI